MNENFELQPAPQKVRGSGKKIFLAALFGGALILATAFLLRRAETRIVIPEPAPLPNPNAFDVYVKAGTMLVPSPALAYGKDATPDVLQGAMKDNAPSLRVLRQGFALPYQQPNNRSAAALFPYYAKYREMARQLLIESRVLAARKDWNGAMNSRLDALQLGSDVPRGSGLIGGLVGYAVNGIARKDAHVLEPHLTAPQARAAAKRLETIMARSVPASEFLTEEKWTGLTQMRTIIGPPGWRVGAARAFGGIQWLLVSPQKIERNYAAMMDAQIANVKTPFNAPKQPIPAPNNPYTRSLSLVHKNTGFVIARNETGSALLLVNLWLRAFRQERGDFPKSLTELAPSYLKRIPLDPFGSGGPLRYIRLDQNNYRLYSVGPDGKDDGGTPVQNTRYSDSRRFRVLATSRGDMVLGISL